MREERSEISCTIIGLILILLFAISGVIVFFFRYGFPLDANEVPNWLPFLLFSLSYPTYLALANYGELRSLPYSIKEKGKLLLKIEVGFIAIGVVLLILCQLKVFGESSPSYSPYAAIVIAYPVFLFEVYLNAREAYKQEKKPLERCLPLGLLLLFIFLIVLGAIFVYKNQLWGGLFFLFLPIALIGQISFSLS